MSCCGARLKWLGNACAGFLNRTVRGHTGAGVGVGAVEG